jgi:predicted ArsR family transcriptional regulator
MIFPDDTARARKTDPVSSHEAADSTAGHIWESQQATIDILRMHGKPMTALQVEQITVARELPHSPSRMRSTLSELEALGRVERAGFTKPPHGRKRQLWALTKEA